MNIHRDKRESKGRPSLPDDCVQASDYEVDCTVIYDLPKRPTIGDIKVDICRAFFYNHAVVYVSYALSGYDREILLDSLKEKFGEPSKPYESVSLWRWKNAVSSLDLIPDSSDRLAATLTLTLDGKYDELFKSVEADKKRIIKGDL